MSIPAQPTKPGEGRALPVPAGEQPGPVEGVSPPEPEGTATSSPVGRLAATVDRLRREVMEAQAEADGRALVELAKGILVERLGCGPSEAAQQLTVLAGQSGLSPLEFAVDVINQAAKDRVSEVTEAFLAAVGRPDDPAEQSAAVRLRAAESGALAAAHDTQAVADSLLQHALGPLGAVAVAIWAAGSDGSLTLAGSAGFPPGEAERWRYVPPEVATVARSAHSEGTTQWIDSLAGTGLPTIGRHLHPDGAGRPCPPAPPDGWTGSWRSPGRPRWTGSRPRWCARWRPWPTCAPTRSRRTRTSAAPTRNPSSCRTRWS